MASTFNLEHKCPVCVRLFKTAQGVNSHLRQAKSCKWYRLGKLPETLGDQSESESFNNSLPTQYNPDALLATGSEAVTLEVEDDIPDDDNPAFGAAPFDEFYEQEPAEYSFQQRELHIPLGMDGPGPSSMAHIADENRRKLQIPAFDEEEDAGFTVEYGSAAAIIRMDPTMHDKWQKAYGNWHTEDEDVTMSDGTANSGNYLWAPFASELDWRVAQWAVEENVGQGTVDRLLEIPGVAEALNLSFNSTRGIHKIVDESIPDRAGKWESKKLRFGDMPDYIYRVRYRDPRQAIQALLGDPALRKHLVYRPRKVFSNRNRKDKIYSEMWTGDWWWAIQKRLPTGATLAPLIIATDKTQLTSFVGGRSAYPVYLTIGNLPKSVRRKPSMHSSVLIGYLPTDKVPNPGNMLTKEEHRARTQRLFHDSMRLILKPLAAAGRDGMDVVCADGGVRAVFPILANYVADFPEQCLVACTKYGTCPKCRCPADQLGSRTVHIPRTQEWTQSIIDEALRSSTTNSAFHTYCFDRDVSGSIYRPFWHDFPHCDIHSTITPDVLHQLFQGVFKHLLGWCERLIGKAELDQKIALLAPAYGVRHFPKGISGLSQMSGTERKQIAKILLACLVGHFPAEGLLACKGLLDFIYLAQYPSHSDSTLQYLQDALNMFHDNQDFFVKYGMHDTFNIPKFHSLLHYIESIRLFGTTDGYNTEAFERLHIDFAKKGWRASNKRDEFPQMTLWLSRQEKMWAFRVYVVEFLSNEDEKALKAEKHLQRTGSRALSIVKYPHDKSKSLTDIQEQHNAPGFSYHLSEFLNRLLPVPNSSRVLQNSRLPFGALEIYHHFKFSPSALRDDQVEADVVKATPPSKSSNGQFDTVIVSQHDDSEVAGLAGTRIGRVKVIFRLPRGILMPYWPAGPLAYIEWYKPLLPAPNKNHGMFVVQKAAEILATGATPGIIVPLHAIRQSCMLVPNFAANSYRNYVDAKDTPRWTSDTVLDLCNNFLLNNWQSMYTYQTVY